MIHHTAIINKQPDRAKASKGTPGGAQEPAELGEGVILGAYAVVYAGCHLEDDVYLADYARVREGSRIGAKTIIGRGVSIEPGCQVGKRCKFQDHAHLTPESIVGDDCFIGPGVITTNDNSMGRGADKEGVTIGHAVRIGAHATILPGVRIGDQCIIGANALVTRDCEAGYVYMGIPASKVRKLRREELFFDENDPMGSAVEAARYL